MNTNQFDRTFVRVPHRKRPRTQHPVVTKVKTTLPIPPTGKEPQTKPKRLLKVSRTPKTEQTDTENKNTSYMSIYI